MSVQGQTIIQWFEQFSPKHLAEDWDKVGLQIGTLQKEISRVLVTLDITPEVVDEAIAKKAELIIAHHPVIFQSLKHLRTDLPQGKIYEKLIKQDIAVYTAHTNLDITEGGVNDWLAEALQLKDITLLTTTYQEPLKKLVVFVPLYHEGQLRDALGKSGAGHIGQYSHCMFATQGVGSFLPGEGTEPFIGKQGTIEKVDEVRLETIYPASLEKKVLQAMFNAHPYEEVAYDIYPVQQVGKNLGLGRVGKLSQEYTLREFAEHVKENFQIQTCRVVGDLDKTVKKVAVLGGSGSKYLYAALHSGADVYVTGDLDFHTAHDALLKGLALVDPGHHVEKVMITGVQRVLEQFANKAGQKLEVLASEVDTEPFTFL
ncbi:Nif3-like dinuclear metal center hexameric protein [Bacillus horti]|uniref:GTP cyclohydrolase 1 type 2 homolog n=1 Tax=Caldalkalibacillus horti TaxID=77523 RepID=A0ABT9W4A0_9BACI|nr:Nif3-like dinuclear metal center hexameric protein [Bacillus horti]MDQ0168068.1 dinuclear metal center YbgI/SA1388 family protein [Bacillus horti]